MRNFQPESLWVKLLTPDANADFIATSAFALPVEVGRRLRKMHEQFQNSPGDVKTAFTEWLFWAPNDTVPRYDNMGGAVATGGFLNMFLRNSDIVPIADMTGIVEFGGIWKKRSRVFGTPAYWVFKMYSASEIARAVEAESDGQTYDMTHGTSRFPSIEHVPHLDVVAALDDAGDKLTLFCVNRDVTHDLPAKFDLAGFRARPTPLPTPSLPIAFTKRMMRCILSRYTRMMHRSTSAQLASPMYCPMLA